MAMFLTIKQNTSQLENIITNARNELVLISSYIKIADNLFPSLEQADRKNVRITIVYGKQELGDTIRIQFSQVQHLTLRYLEKLHAKYYYNETKMIISSLICMISLKTILKWGFYYEPAMTMKPSLTPRHMQNH